MATKAKETDGVYVSRREYEQLVADARRWRQLQARVADYHGSLSKEKRAQREGAYERWARENGLA